MNAQDGIYLFVSLLSFALGVLIGWGIFHVRSRQPGSGLPPVPDSPQTHLKSVPIDALHDAVIITNDQQAILAWNRGAERMYGYTAQEVIGKNLSRLIHSEWTKEALQASLSALKHDGFWNGQTIHFDKSGQPLRIQSSVSLIKDERGQQIGLVGINHDVTEQVRLEEQLNQQAAFLGAVRDAMIAVDPQYRILYWNRGAELMYGYSSQEAVGQNAETLLSTIRTLEEHSTLGQENFAQKQLKENGVYLRYGRHTTKSGQWIDVETSVYTLFDAHAQAIGYVSVHRDIGERLRAETALHESESRYRLLVQTLPIGVMIQDTTSRILTVNQAALDMLGLTQKQIEGKTSLDPDWDVIHEDGSPFPGPTHPVPQAIASGQPINDVVMGVRRANSPERVWLLVNAIPEFNPDRTLAQVVCTIVDITERKHTAEALLEANQKLTALIQAAPHAIVALDLNGKITHWNPAAEWLFGWHQSEVIGLPNPIVPNEDEASAAGPVGDKLRVESSGNMEVVRRRRDGSLIDVGLSTALLRDSDGRISGTLTMMVDITTQRQTQHQIMRQNEVLAALHETAVALTTRLAIENLLETILKRAADLLTTPDGFIYLIDPERRSLSIRIGIGFYQDFIGMGMVYGQGLAGRVWESGQILAVDHYHAWSGRLPDLFFDRLHGLVGIPLKAGGHVIGVIGLARTDPDRPFTRDELNILARFAELTSVALDNARLYEAAQQELSERKRAEQALQHQNMYLTALHETTLAVVNRSESRNLLETLIVRAGELVGGLDGHIYLAEPGQDYMVGRVATGRMREFLGRTIRKGEGLSGRAWETNTPLAVNDYKNWPGRIPFSGFDEFRALVAIPLKSGDQMLGILSLADFDTDRKFGPDEIAILSQFGDLAAIVLDNTRLYDAAQQEIVERKRAEDDLRHLNAELELRVQRRTAELKEQQAQLRAVLDSMGEGVLYSEGQTIIYTNQAVTEITGYAVEELIEQPISIFRDPDSLTEPADPLFDSLIQSGVTWRGEQTWQHKDGRPFDAALTVRLIEGRGRGSVTIVRDVTAEKQLQRQKAEFISNASHELRTPLTNFKTRLYLMRRQPEQSQEHMAVLVRVTDRMVRLVEDLLDVSRFERGVIPLLPEDVVLQSLVAEVAETQRPEAERKNIQLACELPADPIHVLADPNRITQVIVNLVINAINYTLENGTISLRLFCAAEQAVIQVQDSGIGIRPENLARIFEPFFRANEGTARGTGLGLSISKEIVELHGGTLNVQSTPGLGSTFSVYLPVLSKNGSAPPG